MLAEDADRDAGDGVGVAIQVDAGDGSTIEHTGWIDTTDPNDWRYGPPVVPCGVCVVSGDRTPLLLTAVEVTGGALSLLWHMKCRACGTAISYPATSYADSEAS